MTTELTIRRADKRHIPQILAIEDSATYAWDRETLIRTWHTRNCIAVVAEAHNAVVAHMLYKVQPGSITLLKVEARPGCADALATLVSHALRKLAPGRRPTLVYLVGERDHAKLCALRGCGLTAVALKRSHFGDDDAYVMQHDAAGTSPHAQRLRSPSADQKRQR